MTHQLEKIGVVVGKELEVVSNTPSCSTIIAVENQNIGLGANPANNIMVSYLIYRGIRSNSI